MGLTNARGVHRDLFPCQPSLLPFNEYDGINVSKREHHVTFVVLFCPRTGEVHVAVVNGSNRLNLL